ncbi:MAG: BTAD domain-containing putative transcriptional regulator [Candidatus Baltobacteraceae bacterium]
MAKQSSAPAPVLDRRRVLERIDQRGAPLVVLLAPAGYGKSHLAQRLASPYEHSLYLQCSKATDFLAGLAQLLGASSSGPGEIRDAWRRHQNTALTLDNIECLRWHPEALDSFQPLLEPNDGSNKVIFCGRMDPGLGFANEAAPHTITFLRSEQLALDEAETRDLYASTPVDDAMRYRLHVFTGGWLAAALYCAQFAKSGDVNELFDSPVTAFADFLDYIDTNVTDNLPEHVLSGLCAVVGVPGIRGQEMAELYGHDQADVAGDMTRLYEVASLRDPGVFYVNRLLRFAVRTKRSQLVADAQRAVGDLCSKRHDYGRAAQLYLASGDVAKAEEFLKCGRQSGHASFDSFSPLPEAGQIADLVSHPELWAAVLGARRLSEHPSVLANEALTVLESLDGETDPMVAMQVRSLSAIAFMDAGMIEEATAVVDVKSELAGNPETRTVLPILSARATLDSYIGNVDRALAIWHRIRPFALENPSVFAQLTRIEIRAARYRGEWEVEYDQLQRMLHAANESRAVTLIAMALGEGVFGSWLAHETDIFDEYVAQLASLMREHELPALLNFQLASVGLRPTTKSTSKYWDAIAFLMTCARELDAQRAAEFAHTASRFADDSGATFLRVLARVAISEKTPSLRAEMLREALALAESVDSSALRESLASALTQSALPLGMLAPFLARLRANGNLSQPVTELDLRIRLGDAVVCLGGKAIPVSEGGWGLLLMLSSHRAVHRDVLCDRLWPAMSLESGYNALKMCVRRTRLQLGSAEAIISTQGGYALANWVRVDIDEMEHLESALQKGTFDDECLPEVQRHFDALRQGRPANFATWEWFAEREQQLESLARTFGQFLGRRAIAGADYHTAVQIGEYLRKLDPLDEDARSLLITAHVAHNDEAAAERELRLYQKVLKDELNSEPSADLNSLLTR